MRPTIIALAVNGACQIIGQLYHHRKALEAEARRHIAKIDEEAKG